MPCEEHRAPLNTAPHKGAAKTVVTLAVSKVSSLLPCRMKKIVKLLIQAPPTDPRCQPRMKQSTLRPKEDVKGNLGRLENNFGPNARTLFKLSPHEHCRVGGPHCVLVYMNQFIIKCG